MAIAPLGTGRLTNRHKRIIAHGGRIRVQGAGEGFRLRLWHLGFRLRVRSCRANVQEKAADQENVSV